MNQQFRISNARRSSITVGLGILLPALMFSAPQSTEPLTVRDVVKEVLRAHPAIQMATEQVQASEARVKIAESAWMPTVGVEAAYTRLAPVAKVSFGPTELRLYPAGNLDAHVIVRQQVYDFGRTSAAVDVGRARVQSSNIGVTAARSGLAYQAIQAFLAIQYLRAAVDVQSEQIRTLDEHIAVTKKRVDAGSATDFDVLTTQVRVASAHNQQIDLQNAEAKAEIALRRLMGRSDTANVELAGTFGAVEVPRDEEQLIRRAIENRPDVRSAAADEQAALLQVRISDLSDLPSLSAGVAYGVKNGYMPNLDVLRGNLAATIRLDVPLAEGGRPGFRKEEAEALHRMAQSRLEDLNRQVAQDVRQAVSDLRSSSEKLAASELQVNQAQEAVTIARKRYEAGAISNLDLLDAETSLEQAKLARLQSLYAVTSSRTAFDRALGAEPWK